MKLGEIKLESLRLMNANDEDLNIDVEETTAWKLQKQWGKLAAFAAVACVALAFVNNLTAPAIAKAEAEKAKMLFGDIEEVSAGVVGEFAFVTKKMSEKAFEEKAARVTVLNRIRTEWEA